MKKLSRWVKEAGAYPQCLLEWRALYGASAVDTLCRCGCLAFGNAHELPEEVFDGMVYKINPFNDTVYGVNDDGESKVFSEEDLRKLILREEKFAELLSKSVGFTTETPNAFQYGGAGYTLGAFKIGNGNDDYIVFLCFNFLNFEKEFDRYENSGRRKVPIVYAMDGCTATKEAHDLIVSKGGAISLLSDSFEVSARALKCLIMPKTLAGYAENAKIVEKPNSVDKWDEDYPRNPKWSDVVIKMDKAREWLHITYGGETKDFFWKNISFFRKANDEATKEWVFFQKIMADNARSGDETNKKYQTILSRHFKKFFNINKGNPFASDRAAKRIRATFKLIVPEREKESRKQPKQTFGSGYEGPYDNEYRNRKNI